MSSSNVIKLMKYVMFCTTGDLVRFCDLPDNRLNSKSRRKNWIPGSVVKVTSSHVHIKSHGKVKKILKRNVKVPLSKATVLQADHNATNDTPLKRGRRRTRLSARDDTPDWVTERVEELKACEQLFEETRIKPVLPASSITHPLGGFNWYTGNRDLVSLKDIRGPLSEDIPSASAVTTPLVGIVASSPEPARTHGTHVKAGKQLTIEQCFNRVRPLLSTTKSLPNVENISVELTEAETISVVTSGTLISTRVVEAFLAIARGYGEHQTNFTGFENPSAVKLQSKIDSVRNDIAAGKTCLQILHANLHFVTSVKIPGENFVSVYNSLNEELHPLILIQLYRLYAEKDQDLTVKFPVTRKQPLLSNLCAVMACSYSADVLTRRSPHAALYVDEREQ